MLYNGKLWGVRNIERSGDAHFTYHNLHEVDVNCTFYFEQLNVRIFRFGPRASKPSTETFVFSQFQYDFQANIYNKVSTDGRADGNIQQLLAVASLDLDFKNRSIELTSLTLKNVK